MPIYFTAKSCKWYNYSRQCTYHQVTDLLVQDCRKDDPEHENEVKEFFLAFLFPLLHNK